MIGALILEKLLNLYQEDEDEIMASLLAAVFAHCLATDQTPRTTLDPVWAALPSCDAWRSEIEDAIRAAIELREAQA